MKSSWKLNKEILFLSRVHVKKGINFLLEAVAQLKEQMEGYVIRIAGEGDDIYIDELKQLTVRLGISKLVIFEGGVYGNSKWELFRQADLFILPTHSENFGIVVAEALASLLRGGPRCGQGCWRLRIPGHRGRGRTEFPVSCLPY